MESDKVYTVVEVLCVEDTNVLDNWPQVKLILTKLPCDLVGCDSKSTI